MGSFGLRAAKGLGFRARGLGFIQGGGAMGLGFVGNLGCYRVLWDFVRAAGFGLAGGGEGGGSMGLDGPG